MKEFFTGLWADIKTVSLIYLITAWDTVSQLLNAWLFNSTNANQSLSGRCWEERDHWFWGRFRVFIDFLFLKIFKQEDHCFKAYRADRIRGAIAAGIPADLFLQMVEDGELPVFR